MMIDASHFDIFKGKITEPADRLIDRHLARLHFSQQLFDSLLIQRLTLLFSSFLGAAHRLKKVDLL
jgi:hypothetical protein